MKACLFSGAKASNRLFAITISLAELLEVGRFDFEVGGKAVIVCEVEVLDEVVLPGLAIASGGYIYLQHVVDEF